MNSIIKCTNCGAEVSITNAVCRYCKTPIRPVRDLSDADRKKISDVVSAMEETLHVASGSSWILGAAFLILSIIALGSYFVYSSFILSIVTVWVLTVFSVIVLFITFGAMVDFSERRAVKKAYQDDVKLRIDEYLKLMKFHRYEFDGVADDLLPKKALLRRFLFMA